MPLSFDKRERDERRLAGKSHTCEYCDSPDCEGTCEKSSKHKDGSSVLDALESKVAWAGGPTGWGNSLDPTRTEWANEMDPNNPQDAQYIVTHYEQFSPAVAMQAQQTLQRMQTRARWEPKHAAYEDEGSLPSCPTCGGPGMPLGQLGRRTHFRCRNCGMDFSHEAHPDDVAAHEQDLVEQDPSYWEHYLGKTADASVPPEDGWQQKPTADPYNPAAYESLVGGGGDSAHGNVGMEAYKWAVQEGATPQEAAEQARGKEQAALHQGLQGQHPTNMYQVTGSWVSDSQIERTPRLLS